METPLGKPSDYADGYDRGRLVPLERVDSRRTQGVGEPADFAGVDLWRGYEFSWLDAGGRPRVAGLTFTVDAASPRLVESKSMKLYLNGFAQSRFDAAAAVRARLEADLGDAFGVPVTVALPKLAEFAPIAQPLPGRSLDEVDTAIDTYEVDPALLVLAPSAPAPMEETVHTDLFRSVCPVTGQPDWATLSIRYRGAAIDHAALLRYLVSYRRHAAFHETTVERIYQDIRARCGCERLLVAGYFQRRGGIDINPIRADEPQDWPLLRTVRQ
jgi:7-cyano-7-deazaguanine reductase